MLTVKMTLYLEFTKLILFIFQPEKKRGKIVYCDRKISKSSPDEIIQIIFS